jgi:hypothetical protein
MSIPRAQKSEPKDHSLQEEAMIRFVMCASIVLAGTAGVARADVDCEKSCVTEWPREYLHAAQRNLCLGKCWAADKARAAAAAASRTYEAAKEKVGEAIDTVKEKTSAAVETIKETASDAADKVKSTANKVYEGGKQTIESGKKWAKDKYESGKKWAKDKYEAGKKWAKDKYEAGKKWAKDKYEAGKKWTKDKWNAAKGWAVERYKKARDWTKRALSGGKSYAQKQVKDAFAAIKELDCGKLVQAASNLDPTTILLQQVPMLGHCAVKAREGFWCSIPDTVKELGKVVVGSAKEAWNHKWKCLSAGVATTAVMAPGAGAAMCGLYYYAKPRAQKLGRCLQQLFRSKSFFADVKKMFKSKKSEGDLKKALVGAACKFVGALVLDAVITLATEGASLPGTVSKWLAWALPMGTKILPKAGVTLAAGVQARRYGGLAALVLSHAPQCQ